MSSLIFSFSRSLFTAWIWVRRCKCSSLTSVKKAEENSKSILSEKKPMTDMRVQRSVALRAWGHWSDTEVGCNVSHHHLPKMFGLIIKVLHNANIISIRDANFDQGRFIHPTKGHLMDGILFVWPTQQTKSGFNCKGIVSGSQVWAWWIVASDK